MCGVGEGVGSRTLFPESTLGLQMAVGGRKEECGLCPFLSPAPVMFCVLRLSPGRKQRLGTGTGQGLVGELGSPSQRALCSRVLETGTGVGQGTPAGGLWEQQRNPESHMGRLTYLGSLFSG